MENLNKNQQRAANHPEGPMMVLAGPGSGKTAVITARAVLLSQRVKPSSVLVITFSKSAANEMKKRFQALYMEKTPEVNFGTFHSTFFRMLRQSAGYDLKQLIGESEKRNVIKGFLSNMKYALEEETVSQVINELSLMQNELLEKRFYHSKTIATNDFLQLDEAYEKHKNDSDKIDFDDMLTHTYDMLLGDKNILSYWQNRFEYIMIDEFQDINRVQYETIKLMAAPKNNLFVVGDDDQSIYRFRGSRPEFLLNFPKDYENVQKITLDTNYRSTDEIIFYSNKVIQPNTKRFDKKITGTAKKGPKPLVMMSEDQNQEAAKIGELLRKMAKKGESLSEVAIAFRLNIQARAFIDAFLHMNIPFVSRDEIPTLYGHWIAEDFYAYLRLAERVRLREFEGFDEDAARIINKPFRYISKAFLAGLKKYGKNLFREYWQDDDLHIATKTSIEEFQDNLLRMSKLPTPEAIRFLRKKMGYDGHIVDNSEYRKLNSTGLFEIADELTESAKQFALPADFVAHGLGTAEAAKSQPNHSDSVTLTTLHSAKGLEFEKVFVAGAVEDVLPHLNSQTPAEIEEERRLFYVGITRAKKELYISVVKNRYDKKCQPSRFLLKN